MSNSIIHFLGDHPLMRIVRSLFHSPRPRHLRSLASEHSLSASGVSDILRRLGEAGLLDETRQGNKRCFSLKLKSSEHEALGTFLKAYEIAFIESRAPQFERRAVEKLAWMDEAFQFYRDVKTKHHDTA